MKKLIYIFVFILPVLLFSCSGSNNEAEFGVKKAVDLYKELQLNEIAFKAKYPLYSWIKIYGEIDSIAYMSNMDDQSQKPGIEFITSHNSSYSITALFTSMDPLVNLSAGQNIIVECSIGNYDWDEMQLVNCSILNEAEAEAKARAESEAKAKAEAEAEAKAKDAEVKAKEENAHKVDSYSKAKEFYNLGNYSEAYQYFQYVNSADEEKFDEANYYLGFMSMEGMGTNKNYSVAETYLRISIQSNFDKISADSKALKGIIFINKQNYSEAVKWLRISIEQNNSVIGQFYLAYLYENGLGVTQSDTEAIKYYKLAADQGDLDAKKDLDRMKNK